MNREEAVIEDLQKQLAALISGEESTWAILPDCDVEIIEIDGRIPPNEKSSPAPGRTGSDADKPKDSR